MTTAPEDQRTSAVPADEYLLPARIVAVDAEAEVKADVGTTDSTRTSAAADADTNVALPTAVTLMAGHKGKLAIGVAATLGLMVYYGWREKRLAQTDPEEYARLQRIKAGLRRNVDLPAPEDDGVYDAAPDPSPETDAKP